ISARDGAWGDRGCRRYSRSLFSATICTIDLHSHCGGCFQRCFRSRCSVMNAFLTLPNLACVPRKGIRHSGSPELFASVSPSISDPSPCLSRERASGTAVAVFFCSRRTARVRGVATEDVVLPRRDALSESIASDYKCGLILLGVGG